MVPAKENGRLCLLGFVALVHWSIFCRWVANSLSQPTKEISMGLLSRQVHRTFFSPSVLTSAQRRWLRCVGIGSNVIVTVAVSLAVIGFIVIVNMDAQRWFLENVFSKDWYHATEVWWRSITPWNRSN